MLASVFPVRERATANYIVAFPARERGVSVSTSAAAFPVRVRAKDCGSTPVAVFPVRGREGSAFPAGERSVCGPMLAVAFPVREKGTCGSSSAAAFSPSSLPPLLSSSLSLRDVEFLVITNTQSVESMTSSFYTGEAD